CGLWLMVSPGQFPMPGCLEAEKVDCAEEGIFGLVAVQLDDDVIDPMEPAFRGGAEQFGFCPLDVDLEQGNPAEIARHEVIDAESFDISWSGDLGAPFLAGVDVQAYALAVRPYGCHQGKNAVVEGFRASVRRDVAYEHIEVSPLRLHGNDGAQRIAGQEV